MAPSQTPRSRGSKVAHHDRRDARGADGDDRHLDRQRRAHRHPRELRHAARSDRLGLDRLHDGEHRRHPDDRLVPAPLRLPEYFAASILLFTAASALCGLAWNLPSLVVFRVLQGMGGGAIIPTAQSDPVRALPARASTAWPAASSASARSPARCSARPIGGYLIDVVELALDLPRQRADRHRRRGASRERSSRSPASRPTPRRSTAGIALLAVGMAVAAVRARGGQPRGLVHSRRRSSCSPPSRRSRSSRSSSTSSRPITRSSICACSRTAATPPAPASTSSSGSRCFGARTCSRSTAAGHALHGARHRPRIPGRRARRRSSLMPIVGKIAHEGRPALHAAGRRVASVGALAVDRRAADRRRPASATSCAPQMVRAIGLGFIFIPVSVAALSRSVAAASAATRPACST